MNRYRAYIAIVYLFICHLRLMDLLCILLRIFVCHQILKASFPNVKFDLVQLSSRILPQHSSKYANSCQCGLARSKRLSPRTSTKSFEVSKRERSPGAGIVPSHRYIEVHFLQDMNSGFTVTLIQNGDYQSLHPDGYQCLLHHCTN